MRKLIFLSAFFLTAAFAAAPKVTVTSFVAEGQDCFVQVRNDSEIVVTAFLVGGSEKDSVSTDMLLGAREGRLLKPGETAEVKVPGTADPQVLAAIFEGGSTEGEASSLATLLQARRAVYLEIPFALSLLENENVNNFPASTVATWFRQWRERWQAGDPADVVVASVAEIYLKQAGNETATRPARELKQVFEELSTKLAASQPPL